MGCGFSKPRNRRGGGGGGAGVYPVAGSGYGGDGGGGGEFTSSISIMHSLKDFLLAILITSIRS